jgi:hypothetical protein
MESGIYWKDWKASKRYRGHLIANTVHPSPLHQHSFASSHASSTVNLPHTCTLPWFDSTYCKSQIRRHGVCFYFCCDELWKKCWTFHLHLGLRREWWRTRDRPEERVRFV